MLPTPPAPFMKGYLVGALLCDGFYDGFYPIPLILSRNKRVDRKAISEKIVTYAAALKGSRLIVPPTVLEYADGSYGVESQMVELLARESVAKFIVAPLPRVYSVSTQVAKGILAAAVESLGRLDENRILIKTPRSRETLEVLQVFLLRGGFRSSITESGLVIRGEELCKAVLGWLGLSI